MALHSDPEQALAAEIAGLCEREQQLTPRERLRLEFLRKHAVYLSDENARYRERQRVLLAEKQKECERLRQHAFLLDERSRLERNIVKKKVLRWLAWSYLVSAQEGNVGVKLRHIIFPPLVILALCVGTLFYAGKMLLESGPSAFAVLLGCGALWVLWGIYRDFTR